MSNPSARDRHQVEKPRLGSLISLLVCCFLSGCANGNLINGDTGHKSINRPGEYVDVTRFLEKDKYTCVVFYADWCSACKRLTPIIDECRAKSSDAKFIYVDIAEWDSPVATKYQISAVPTLLVYDAEGILIAQKSEALGWLIRYHQLCMQP